MTFNKDSFGKPGEGFHKHVFGVPIFDVLGTVAVGYFIAKTFDLDPTNTIITTFIVGEAAHYYFGVDTVFIKAIGLSRGE
jgi:hypothetical protein